MAKYSLSNIADQDLIGIAEYSVLHFGIPQTRTYQTILVEHFELLAEQPFLFPAVDHIRPGYQRSVCQAHSVYYRVVDDGVELMGIINRQSPERHLAK